MVQSPSWEANWFAASQKFPVFHGTPRFTTALTSFRHLFLSWASPIQSIYPHPTSWWSILILSTSKHPACECFLTKFFLQGAVVSTSPNPQAGGPHLVGCPWLLIQFIRSYPPYRRPFLYPQPEDAPYRGHRDPLQLIHSWQNVSVLVNHLQTSTCTLWDRILFTGHFYFKNSS